MRITTPHSSMHFVLQQLQNTRYHNIYKSSNAHGSFFWNDYVDSRIEEGYPGVLESGGVGVIHRSESSKWYNPMLIPFGRSRGNPVIHMRQKSITSMKPKIWLKSCQYDNSDIKEMWIVSHVRARVTCLLMWIHSS